MSKTKRTGASLMHSAADCPKSLYLTLGFTEEQASRMMEIRRILPIVDNRREPIIDARKLWEEIGKPHGRFDKWVDYHLKPLLHDEGGFAEISAKVSKGKTGRPRLDFTLSRDVAAHLAMQANTPDGRRVREYFLNMEDAALRLARHQPFRATLLIKLDNELTHTTRKQAGAAAKEGLLSKELIPLVSTANEKRIKSLVCRILTGHSASEWHQIVGRRIRDSLDTADVNLYGRCYDMAISLFRAGFSNDEILIDAIAPTFGGKIDIARYAEHVGAA